jgi:hypothetical protein
MAKKSAKRSKTKKKAPKDLTARKSVKGGLMATRMRTKQPIGFTAT